MPTHSSILTWEIPWMEEPGGLHPWGHHELDTTEQTHTLCMADSTQYLLSFSVMCNMGLKLKEPYLLVDFDFSSI